MSEPLADGSVGEGSDPASRDLAMQLAHGQAALLLLECLMLALIEQKTLSAEQMVEAVDTVLATKLQMVRDADHPQVAKLAAGLLSRIANSLAAAEPLAPTAPTRS
jgi:hypothetical protein